MNRVLWGAIYLLIVVNALLLGVYWVSDYLTGNGIDDSVLYQVVYGFDGLDHAGFLHLYAIGTLGLFAFAALLILWHRSRFRQRLQSHWMVMVCLAFVGTLAFNPAPPQIYSVLKAATANEAHAIVRLPNGVELDFRKLYGFDQLKRAKDIRPKNLVYIYAESLEKAFFDTESFGDVLPQIRELSRAAIRFDNIFSPLGTTWTLGGMVGSQCGVPLAAPVGQENQFENFQRFLPRASCLGDALRHLGYDLRYLQGSVLSFAGNGKFYADHGFDNVMGRDELQVPGESLGTWGRYDRDTLASALEQFRGAKAGGRPFGVFLALVDMHPPSGFLSPGCPAASDGPQMLAVVSCVDSMIAQFIRAILREDPETVIVLSSDHPMMRNELPEAMFPEVRPNSFFIWNSSKALETPILQSRLGSMFDVGPTVAEAMGLESGAIGLGVSLFKPRATLAERAGGLQGLNEAVRAWMPFFRNLWYGADPATDQIALLPDESGLSIGTQQLQLPVMLDFDESSNFLGASFNRLLRRFNDAVRGGHRPALFHYCNETSWVIGTIDETLEGVCVLYLANDGALHFRPIQGGEKIFLVEDSSRRLTVEEMEAVSARLAYYAETGTFPEADIHVLADRPMESSIKLTSAGLLAGAQSKVVDKGGGQPLVHRGINVLHIREDGTAMLLGHLDTCAPPQGDPSIRDLISANGAADGVVALVVNDSAVCGNPLDWAIGDLDLPVLGNLKLRQAYVGLLTSAGVQEFKGGVYAPLFVELLSGAQHARSVSRR